MAEQLIYPRGQIAQQNGDLLDVTNVKTSTKNNGKQVHTIRRKGAGVTLGVEESTVSYDVVISQDGPERDYFNDVKKGRIRQLRVKVPGLTLTFNGIYTSMDFELPLDDAIKLTMEFVGHLED